MATRQQRLDAFTTEGEPPTRQPMELLCEDKSGTYVPPFYCSGCIAPGAMLPLGHLLRPRCWDGVMSRRPSDPHSAAEAAFKKVTATGAAPETKSPSLPGVKETVSLRIDREILDHFQAEGPGWQDAS
jgi:hypothetical protein